MKKIIVSEFVMLDGVMEAPRGEPGHPHSGWVRARLFPETPRKTMLRLGDTRTFGSGVVVYSYHPA